MQYKLKNIFLLSLLTTSSIYACNSSHVIGNVGSGAVYTMSANTMQKGDMYIGVNYESANFKSLSDQTIIQAVQNGSDHIHSVDTINDYSLSFSYGLQDDLTLSVLVPYMETINIRAGELDAGIAEVHPHADVKGMGDISAILQYKIFDDSKNKIAVMAGIKAPTGKDNIVQEGETLEIDLLPGTGSWDYYAGAAYTREFDNFSFHSNVLYKHTTTGVLNSQVGNILSYNAAVAFKLLGEDPDYHTELRELDENHDHLNFSVDGFVEINGEYDGSNTANGLTVDNTGSDLIFLTTGVQVITNQSYSGFLAIGIPLYQDYNGIQNDNNYKLTLGIGKSF